MLCIDGTNAINNWRYTTGWSLSKTSIRSSRSRIEPVTSWTKAGTLLCTQGCSVVKLANDDVWEVACFQLWWVFLYMRRSAAAKQLFFWEESASRFFYLLKWQRVEIAFCIRRKSQVLKQWMNRLLMHFVILYYVELLWKDSSPNEVDVWGMGVITVSWTRGLFVGWEDPGAVLPAGRLCENRFL